MQRFLITRNGQNYGPYTTGELQRYLASGHILITDLARPEASGANDPASADTSNWVPVSSLIAPGTAAKPGTAYTPPLYATAASGLPNPQGLSPYIEAPPNLSWGLYILFAVLTCGIFTAVYELIQAGWMRRVYPSSKALFFYLAALGFYVLRIAFSILQLPMRLHGQWKPLGAVPILGALCLLGYLVFLIVARFTMRSELEQHFNTAEPIGLALGGAMTFFFGSFYFQYHFNRINQLRTAMHYGALGPQ